MTKEAAISKRTFKQLVGYIKRVYHFNCIVKGVQDDRKWRAVSGKNIFIPTFRTYSSKK